MTPQRTLALNLRRHIEARRNFSVEHRGGQIVRYTCQTCGWHEQGPYLDLMSRANGTPMPTGEIDEALLQRRVAYENQRPGVQGVCPRCTKVERDRRFPLRGSR